jgi:hypothetical protein
MVRVSNPGFDGIQRSNSKIRLLTSFALIVAALAITVLHIPAPSASAAPTTTTTLSPSTVAAGNAYAARLLDAQPIPPSARLVSSLPTPLAPNGSVWDSPAVRQIHREYLLPLSVDVDQFVVAHLPSGEKTNGTGSGSSPNALPVYNLEVDKTCVSRHITFCGVYYQTTEARNGEQELRVDVQVIWLPILHIAMPTTGVVTVTGYGTTSLMNSSSDPATVVLTRHQALALRRQIEGLNDLGDTSICAEDSQLLVIMVTQVGRVVWSAVADACPGALRISSATSNAILDNRSCSFWHIVNTFFPASQATATKSDGARSCNDSQYG